MKDPYSISWAKALTHLAIAAIICAIAGYLPGKHIPVPVGVLLGIIVGFALGLTIGYISGQRIYFVHLHGTALERQAIFEKEKKKEEEHALPNDMEATRLIHKNWDRVD